MWNPRSTSQFLHSVSGKLWERCVASVSPLTREAVLSGVDMVSGTAYSLKQISMEDSFNPTAGYISLIMFVFLYVSCGFAQHTVDNRNPVLEWRYFHSHTRRPAAQMPRLGRNERLESSLSSCTLPSTHTRKRATVSATRKLMEADDFISTPLRLIWILESIFDTFM